MIIPNVEKGIHVISDRYALSTLAYQQTQGVSLKELINMHRGLLIPDLTFLVDVPVPVALERMKTDAIRKEEQKFEKDREFIEKLRQNYLKLKSELLNQNIIILNGAPSAEEVFEKQIKPIYISFVKPGV